MSDDDLMPVTRGMLDELAEAMDGAADELNARADHAPNGWDPDYDAPSSRLYGMAHAYADSASMVRGLGHVDDSSDPEGAEGSRRWSAPEPESLSGVATWDLSGGDPVRLVEDPEGAEAAQLAPESEKAKDAR